MFEEVCPYYLAIGMSLDEYWNGSPHLAKVYRAAHRLKAEEENQKAWLQGLYIKSALDSSLSALFGKRGNRGTGYLEKPLELFEKSEKEKKRDALRERRRIVEALEKMRIARIENERKEKRQWQETENTGNPLPRDAKRRSAND
ncbi:MAG: hypothetical protein IJM21_09180 [Clostridia bacterium]|nr:hypothetical protein [Clostridia bacterium]